MSTAQSKLFTALPPGYRCFLCGASGSGKSTLSAGILRLTRDTYPTARIVIFDLKRRYFPTGQDDAPLFPSGINARLVRRRIGVPVNGVLIDGEPTLLQRRKRVWILQGLTAVIRCIRWLYDHADARTKTYIYADETNALMESVTTKRVYEKILSEGREINIGAISIHQRPKLMSRSLITESERIFIGHLRHADDRKYLADALGIDVLLQPMYSWVALDQISGDVQTFRTVL